MFALAMLLPKVTPQASTGLHAMTALMRRGSAVTSLIAASIMYTGTYGVYTYITPFLSEHSGISGAVLSAIFLANGIAGFLGNMAGGWISGRSPYKSVLTTVVLAIGAILLLPVLGASPAIAIGLVTLWGFSLSMQAISMQIWLQGNAPDQREAMQALFVCLSQTALGLGALAGGIVVDHVGTSGAMLFGGIASLTTLVLAMLQQRLQPSTDAAQRAAAIVH